MVGDRFKPLTYAEMTAAQKKMFENLISGERRGASGPFNVLLRSPEMGDLAQQFGASMRFHSSIPPKLNELAIIITARHWTSQYEWYAHRRAAQTAGLSQSIIDAVAAGTRPAAMAPDEEAVYNFCTELLTTKQVSDATFSGRARPFRRAWRRRSDRRDRLLPAGVDAAQRRPLSAAGRRAGGAEAAAVSRSGGAAEAPPYDRTPPVAAHPPSDRGRRA